MSWTASAASKASAETVSAGKTAALKAVTASLTRAVTDPDGVSSVELIASSISASKIGSIITASRGSWAAAWTALASASDLAISSAIAFWLALEAMDSAVSRSRGSSTASTASTTSITSETVFSTGAPNPKSRTADLGSSAIVSTGAGAALGDSVVLGLKKRNAF